MELKDPKMICHQGECRACMFYKHDKRLGGLDNIPGTEIESGVCSEFGHVYGAWIGYTNVFKNKIKHGLPAS